MAEVNASNANDRDKLAFETLRGQSTFFAVPHFGSVCCITVLRLRNN